MWINKLCNTYGGVYGRVTYCSILNGKFPGLVSGYSFNTTKSTTFAPKAKCKNDQSYLNMIKHD